MVDQPTPAEMNGHARPSPTDRHLGELFQREVQRLAHAVEPGERETDLGLIDSATFFSTDYCLEWLVNGLLVRDQPGVLGGPKKALKTSLIVDLALSLASGRPFLGQFAVLRPVRVGLISGESGQATLQETARRVATAKRISNRLPQLPIHWGFRLPRLSVEEDLDQLADVIEVHDLDVIILDPLYLSLLAGGAGQQASNLFDIGPLLAAVADTCLTAGATPLLVHHTRKNAAKGNSHAAPPELEDLAFAGIQEFARQWLLVGRRQPYVPNSGEHRLWLNVGGSAGHSGCWAVDVEEGRLGADFRGRRWSVQVRNASDERRAVAVQQARRRDAETDERHAADLEAMRQALRRSPDGDTLTRLRDASGLNSRATRILNELIDLGEVERAEIQKPAGRARSRSYEGYRLVRHDAEETEQVNDDPSCP